MIRAGTLLAVSLATLIAAAAPVFAETMMFKADLKGSSEVPANDSGGSGDVMLTLDTEGKTVAWKVTYSGLTGDATAAHFHGPAGPGENAGPAVDVSANIMEGSAPVSDAQIADLQGGKWYLNIHTAKFPDGEIRGQLAPAK